MTIKERLCEAYFQLRKTSPGLRRDGLPFQNCEWHQAGKTMVRYAGDQKLLVYEVEDKVCACIVFADGTSKEYS